MVEDAKLESADCIGPVKNTDTNAKNLSLDMVKGTYRKALHIAVRAFYPEIGRGYADPLTSLPAPAPRSPMLIPFR